MNATAIHPPRPALGFTLVELTLVLLIISLLLAGMLMPLSIQRDLRSYADTKKTMEDIKEALIGFALTNGRLPCPAIKTLADGTTDGTTNGNTNAGFEALTGNACTSITGVIPWATLNVPETDEWGGRFTYHVTRVFADTFAASTWGCKAPVDPASPTSFTLCATGDIRVNSRTTAKKEYYVTNDELPAVFISHGRNGYGAYGARGTLLAAVPAANVDEATNAAPGIAPDVILFSRDRQDASSPCSDTAGATPMCEFDDLVAFVPLAILMNRMVAAGKLP